MKKNIAFFIFSTLVHILIFLNYQKDQNQNQATLNLQKISIKISDYNPPQQKKEKKPQKAQSQNKVSSQQLEFESASLEVKQEAKIISNITPSYPHLSRVYEEQGEVILKIAINDNGQVTHSTIIKSSGYERLDEEALNFIKKVEFLPAQNGKNANISSELVKSISFKLSE